MINVLMRSLNILWPVRSDSLCLIGTIYVILYSLNSTSPYRICPLSFLSAAKLDRSDEGNRTISNNNIHW